METLAKCMAKACGADVDQKLPHRQMTASLSVGFGLLDLLTDLAVSVFFFATANYYWGSLILLTILLTNLWSMYKYSKEIYPWKTTAVMSFFGLLNVRILTRFWAQLDQEAHYRKLMDARLVEVLLESIPSAIVQLYAIVLINTPTVDEFLLIGSCLVSMLNFTYGLRNWYKFTVVNGDTADFEAETKFVFWYVWLEVFCFCDFIVRAGSLALFLSIDNLRPWSLLAAPLVDNDMARKTRAWNQLFFRGFSVGLVSLGSGFMFVLFAESRLIAKLEVLLRYAVSGAFFTLFFLDHEKAKTKQERQERAGWDGIIPASFVIAIIGVVFVLVKQSHVTNDARRRTTAMRFRGETEVVDTGSRDEIDYHD